MSCPLIGYWVKKQSHHPGVVGRKIYSNRSFLFLVEAKPKTTLEIIFSESALFFIGFAQVFTFL